MLQELKKDSFKAVLFLVLFRLLLTVSVWFTVKDGWGLLLKGPTDLNTLTQENIQERFVKASIGQIYDYYVYTTTEDRNGNPVVTEKYYIIPYGEYAYIGMKAPKSLLNKCDRLMDLTNAWLDESILEIPVSRELLLYGTIRPMDEIQHSYYQEYLEWDTLSGELQALFLPYYLDVNQIGENSIVSFCLFNVILLVLLSSVIWTLAKTLTGGYQKSVKHYIRQFPGGEDAALQKLEQFYRSCQPFFQIRMNSEFILIQEHKNTFLIPARDLLWAYMRIAPHTSRGSKAGTTYSVFLKTRNGKTYVTSVGNTSDSCQEFLDKISQMMPHVILGYSNMWNNMYSQKRSQMIEISDAFLNSARNISAFSDVPDTSLSKSSEAIDTKDKQ